MTHNLINNRQKGSCLFCLFGGLQKNFLEKEKIEKLIDPKR